MGAYTGASALPSGATASRHADGVGEGLDGGDERAEAAVPAAATAKRDELDLAQRELGVLPGPETGVFDG